VNPRIDVGVIRLTGELDVARKRELRDVLQLDSAARAVLLDLSEVTYADSTALTQLLQFNETARENGVPVAIVAAAPQFVRLIQYAGLFEAFSVFPDRAGALDHLKEAST